MKHINSFFSPKSVAVVGVSDDPTKLGSVVYSNLVEAGFKGELYPVNPKYQQLYGRDVYAKVSVIPGNVELVVIVVPSQFVVDTMKDCASKGVKAVIIITAGFKEIGETGKRIEDEITRIAKEAEISVMGPNCLGVISPNNLLNASFAASNPTTGNAALMSQSGAFCTAILDMAIPANLGFSHFVSFGNKSDIDEIDLIDYWLKDEQVKVIGAYLEEIKCGQKFVNTIQRNSQKKPIIILKPGQSNEAKKAIASHTGALAGSIETFKTAVQQNGIIEARGIREQFYLLKGFSCLPLPTGKRVAIITNAGGPGIIATDCLIQHGFQMAEISEETKGVLSKSLPDTASLHNPIDVIGDALSDRYSAALHTLAVDPNVDSIFVLLTPQLVTQIEDTAKVIINAIKLYKKPIIPVFVGKKYTLPAMQRFYDNKQAAFDDITMAVEVLSAMYAYGEFQREQSVEKASEKLASLSLVGTGMYRDEVLSYMNSNSALPDELVSKLADEVGIALPKQKVCKSIAEAVEFTKDIFPVVIKATNSAIAHKTDFKALYLNVKTTEELTTCYAELESTIKTHTGLENPEILVQEMIKFEEQMFIGANRDGEADAYSENGTGFGHLIAFGQGGIYTEIYKDIKYILTPGLTTDIEKALNETKVSKILDGARGKDPLAKSEVVKAIEAIQKLVLLYPEIISLDINPLLVTPTRVVAVDIKVFVG